MKIVHFADLHLDAHFAWLGATPQLARERRQAICNTFTKIADVARDVQADALFCGGDLFEHERVTPDTAELLRSVFSALSPMRVFIAPGN
ncbi:MAG: metallophosphoesterase, partial [Tepidiformaceae bacterium]